MSFNCFNRNIPEEAHQRLQQMGPAGVRAFAFTPGGGWVIVTRNGHFARNIPPECFEQIGTLRAAGHEIRCIAFPPEGGNRFLIVTDRTYFARNIPQECFERLGQMWAAGARPSCVAFPRSGGNRWAILAGRQLYCRGIDDECFQLLVNFSQGLRPAQQLAFTPGGGFAILAQDRFFARRVPDECYQQMRAMAATQRLDHLAFSFAAGWSIISNTPARPLPADPLREFEARITQVGGAWAGIRERMAAHGTPGVGVALVQNNQIAWACSYGRTEAGSADWVHNDTVFQAASCSKPVAAVGFLQLVQDNLVGLDEDVNSKLGWTLPRRACAPADWAARVNLRRMLQHRGGIIGRGAALPRDRCSGFEMGGGGGFAGYPNQAGVGVPTVREILAGQSSRPGVKVYSHGVELSYEPDTLEAYSGEAFVLMMQLLQQQRGVAFADWMQARVLAPLGMARSTFALTAPSWSGPPASGHVAGKPIAGKRNRYPEGAAAGLYTTASDLCRFIIGINQGGSSSGQTVLAGHLCQQMLAQRLGMPSGRIGREDEWFWHNGGNAGFTCQFKGFPKRRGGYVVLTNGDQGALHEEIAQALERSYGWA